MSLKKVQITLCVPLNRFYIQWSQQCSVEVCQLCRKKCLHTAGSWSSASPCHDITGVWHHQHVCWQREMLNKHLSLLKKCLTSWRVNNLTVKWCHVHYWKDFYQKCVFMSKQIQISSLPVQHPFGLQICVLVLCRTECDAEVCNISL